MRSALGDPKVQNGPHPGGCEKYLDFFWGSPCLKCPGWSVKGPESPDPSVGAKDRLFHPAVTRRGAGVRSMEVVGVPLSHPLTGWDELHHPFVTAGLDFLLGFSFSSPPRGADQTLQPSKPVGSLGRCLLCRNACARPPSRPACARFSTSPGPTNHRLFTRMALDSRGGHSALLPKAQSYKNTAHRLRCSGHFRTRFYWADWTFRVGSIEYV